MNTSKSLQETLHRHRAEVADVIEQIYKHDRRPTTQHFITKDSGNREEFSTGSRRDTQDGKARYDLIPVDSLTRLADLYSRGAVKYGDWNWQKGQPFSRIYASLFRHLMAFAEGEETEDHLAAVAWNAFAIMHFQDTGRTDLDDMGAYRKRSDEDDKNSL